jgi:ferric-dicitrate binding protein FerR (iron transport regulator)
MGVEDPTGQRDREVEERLRASRPTPDPAFVRALELRLLGRPKAPRLRVRRPLFVGASAAVAMAGAALVLSLAGAGPLAPDGQQAVEATDDCRTVTVVRPERVPMIVTGRDGQPRLEFERRRVEKRVKRCP